MPQSKPNEISFREFYLTFYELPPEYMFIISKLLMYMEHVNDPNFGKESYRDSLNFMKNRAQLTILDICLIIGKKYGYTKDQSIDCLKETVKSAIKRTSRKSQYFNDILSVLSTDEFELELLSNYYNNDEKYGNLKWLYDSISDRNKHIIHYLMNDLLLLPVSQNEEAENNLEQYDDANQE